MDNSKLLRRVTAASLLEMTADYRCTEDSAPPKDFSGYPVYMLRRLFKGYEPSLVAVEGGHEMFVLSKAGLPPAIIVSHTLKVVKVVDDAPQALALAAGCGVAHRAAREHLITYVREVKGKKRKSSKTRLETTK